MTFKPQYTITPVIAKNLSTIEVVREAIMGLPITVPMLASLRETARIISTHHSTAIEGNRLALDEVKNVIENAARFPHRERDIKEVLNYYKALDYVEKLSKNQKPIQEKDIKLLHALAFEGKNQPSPYREAQNIIRNGKLVVYIPPKAEEVPLLMKHLVNWIQHSINEGIPIPFVAGLAHYQFATIHPYYDGNGRTARLLATYILHKNGYDLKGIYSLEEYYAKNLKAYYEALTIGDDEDYYDGNRATADITPFLHYFIEGMAKSFQSVRLQAQNARDRGELDQSLLLRSLSPQQRQILKLFLNSKDISVKAIASYFHFSDRQGRNLCKKWLEEGFIEISNTAPKIRSYRLSEKYESIIQQYIDERVL